MNAESARETADARAVAMLLAPLSALLDRHARAFNAASILPFDPSPPAPPPAFDPSSSTPSSSTFPCPSPPSASASPLPLPLPLPLPQVRPAESDSEAAAVDVAMRDAAAQSTRADVTHLVAMHSRAVADGAHLARALEKSQREVRAVTALNAELRDALRKVTQQVAAISAPIVVGNGGGGAVKECGCRCRAGVDVAVTRRRRNSGEEKLIHERKIRIDQYEPKPVDMGQMQLKKEVLEAVIPDETPRLSEGSMVARRYSRRMLWAAARTHVRRSSAQANGSIRRLQVLCRQYDPRSKTPSLPRPAIHDTYTAETESLSTSLSSSYGSVTRFALPTWLQPLFCWFWFFLVFFFANWRSTAILMCVNWTQHIFFKNTFWWHIRYLMKDMGDSSVRLADDGPSSCLDAQIHRHSRAWWNSMEQQIFSNTCISQCELSHASKLLYSQFVAKHNIGLL